MQINRLFEIVYILMHQKTVTAKELARRFEVSQRTIYRDIDALSQAGIPLYASRGRGGGMMLMEGFVLNKSVLSDDEQLNLLAALQGLNAITPENGQMLSKLSSFFGKHQPPWIEADFSDWNGMQDDKFEVLKSAILGCKQVSFIYHGSNSERSERTVEPYKLWFKHRSWYLDAFCLTKQAPRFFRLSRIHDVVLLDKSFEGGQNRIVQNTPNENFPPSTIFRFLLDASMAYRVMDEFHPSQVQPAENGQFLITMNCPADDWVVGYILSFGENAKLLEPAWLQGVIKQRLEKALQNYS